MKPAEPAYTGRLRAFYEDPGATLSCGCERAPRRPSLLRAEGPVRGSD